MKILALVSEAFGGRGGIAQYNRDLLRALAQCPQVEAVTALPRLKPHDDEEIPAGVTQLAAPASKSGFAVRAAKLWRQGGFDLVLCGHINLMPVASRLSGARNPRIWLVIYGIDAWDSRLSAEARRSLLLVTAISRYTRTRFQEHNPIPQERLKVLPNTVDPRFTPGVKSLDLLEQHGLLESDILLTVGRLDAAEQYKGHDRVIGIMPRLLEADPNLAYVIVGEGDDRVRLEEQANELQLGDRVKFVSGVSDNELVHWYRSADVFVMPSTGEGFGIVFLQAAACGLRVVGGNRDGSVDALRDGQLGIAVDPRSPDQLYRAILTQLDARGLPHPGAVGCFSFPNFQQQVNLIIDRLA